MTLNTFDELPVMIVFTFPSTTDSAESLLTMSLKSTYYPKPISGSRLFVEPALVTRTIDPSGAVFPLQMSYKDAMTLLKDIAAIFTRCHFTETIEMTIHINRTDVTIGLAGVAIRRYKQWLKR